MEPKRVADSAVTLCHLTLPSDANPLGNVHGGVLMRLMDEAGGLAATRHARRPAVTIVTDSISFLSPVYVGNLVTIHAHLTWVGRTSMEVEIRVEAEDVLTGQVTHTNSAYAVYVALDEQGRPTPVPPLALETDEERARWQAAERRRKRRLREREDGTT
ncbi:MAG TPA: acyl-CoA thioesterase [Anaerolineae bacterium]|nr:acyl-CoA thioesterase [Anaerolineae bacterium]HIQ05507.1 acyl-CoA thioesterase [Anaerolineae bacterium]